MSKILFSVYPVTTQVFYQTKFTYALVNLKPIVPGHVLVVPMRVVPRLKDLTDEESLDYMRTVQLIHRFIEKMYKADSLNIAMQDGPAAGQSVPHVHTHIIPRYSVDGFGDGIYDKLEVAADEERKPRGLEVMEKEANWLREELSKFLES